MNRSTDKSDALLYAQESFRRINARVIETFKRSAKYGFDCEQFAYPKGWLLLEQRIEEAIAERKVDLVAVRCDVYEQRARSYCWRWLLNLARTSRQKKAKGASA